MGVKALAIDVRRLRSRNIICVVKRHWKEHMGSYPVPFFVFVFLSFAKLITSLPSIHLSVCLSVCLSVMGNLPILVPLCRLHYAIVHPSLPPPPPPFGSKAS
jgi:hypothetical protein